MNAFHEVFATKLCVHFLCPSPVLQIHEIKFVTPITPSIDN